MNQVTAFGLIARLKNTNLEILDELTGEVILETPATAGIVTKLQQSPRLKRSEKTVMEYKMTYILECLIDEPKLQNYL